MVDGRAFVLARVNGGTDVPLFEHVFTDILVKDQGQWSIAHVRAYIHDTLPKRLRRNGQIG